MPDDLIPIEDKLRPGEILDPASHLIMRGWPVTVEGILANADRTRVRYSLAGEPFVAISAEATIAGWDVDSILMGSRLRSRRSYAITRVGDLMAAGFDLAPTFQAPHYSVLLPSYTQRRHAWSRCSARSSRTRISEGGTREQHQRRHRDPPRRREHGG